jgi:hypothetical protein
VETVAGRGLAIDQVVRAKFLHPLRPGEDITVHCAPAAGESLRYEIRIHCAAGMAALFRLHLREADDDATRMTR